ncbi:hypothetical protein [Streptomyces scabiei]|uniref:hypothetical protein n=1 Tax=Streptomyces scabiei TaxID=1930 RepID=UPI0029A78013|nr:hypothetical protein [Streptomyces scabiei]MDX3524777.1 hypothetical protein [Streptomyces scabiei]
MGKARATQPSGRMSNVSTSTRSGRAVTVSPRPLHTAAASRAARAVDEVDEVEQGPAPLTAAASADRFTAVTTSGRPLQRQLQVRAQGADEPVVVAQVVSGVQAGVQAGERVGDVSVGVVEFHQVGEHLPQRARLRAGSHQGSFRALVVRIRSDRVMRLPKPSIREYALSCPQGGRPPRHGSEFRRACRWTHAPAPLALGSEAVALSAAGAQAVQTHDHGGGRIARLAGERHPPRRHLA